uniref:Uncharacterized protein n=1 Tax=Brassica oleracea var. oleracea TaxID=109376 RepID=A0A0D3CEM9_BRAOL
MRHNMRICITTWRRSLMTIGKLHKRIWKLRQGLASIDNIHPTSIDTHPIASIDIHLMITIDTHEEAAGFHKRVKRIHDPVKFVVPCAVFEAESPIPPDRSVNLGSHSGLALIDTTTSPSIDTGRVSEQKEFDVCGNLFDGETTTRPDKFGGKKRRNWKKRKRTKGGSLLSLIPHFSDGVRKSRVRSRCFSQPFAKLRALLIAEMIYKGEESMDEAFTKE